METTVDQWLPVITQYILGFLVALCSYYLWKRPKNSPPGPRGLPVLGVLPFLSRYPERVFKKWSKEYSPIMSVRIGMTDSVILNDYRSITEVSYRT